MRSSREATFMEVDLTRVYRYLQESLDDFEAFVRHVSD